MNALRKFQNKIHIPSRLLVDPKIDKLRSISTILQIFVLCSFAYTLLNFIEFYSAKIHNSWKRHTEMCVLFLARQARALVYATGRARVREKELPGCSCQMAQTQEMSAAAPLMRCICIYTGSRVSLVRTNRNIFAAIFRYRKIRDGLIRRRSFEIPEDAQLLSCLTKFEIYFVRIYFCSW